MNRRSACIAASLLAGAYAFFFGYEVPDRIQIDGLSTELVPMNTHYADGYSHAGFRRIRIGMSEQEVLDILGEPLDPYELFTPRNPLSPEKVREAYLLYSRPPSLKDTNYRCRVVVMDKDVVVEIIGHFVAD
jgi:hypothetical protein